MTFKDEMIVEYILYFNSLYSIKLTILILEY